MVEKRAGLLQRASSALLTHSAIRVAFVLERWSLRGSWAQGARLHPGPPCTALKASPSEVLAVVVQLQEPGEPPCPRGFVSSMIEYLFMDSMTPRSTMLPM